jgi:hypothetical protein
MQRYKRIEDSKINGIKMAESFFDALRALLPAPSVALGSAFFLPLPPHSRVHKADDFQNIYGRPAAMKAALFSGRKG